MKVKILVTILFILNISLIAKLTAQPVVLWDRTYGETIYDQATDVLPTLDGGFIMTGIPGIGGYLVKTDINGDTLWTRNLPAGFGKILQTPDGGFFIAAAESPSLHLIKTDNMGFIQWQKQYSGYIPYSSENSPFGCDLTADGGYVITGTTDTQPWTIFLMKTNSQGDSLWTRTYGLPSNSWGYSVIQTADLGYAITGSIGDQACLIKTDSQGNVQWNYIYTGNQSSTGYALQQTSDGDYIIGGVGFNYPPSNFYFQLLNISSQGNLVWDSNFQNGSGIHRCYGIDQTSDGGIIMVGETNGGSNDQDTWLLKTDALGDSLWSMFIGGPDHDICNTVHQLDDGSFILAGRTESFAVTGLCDYWLVKIEPQPQVLSTNPRQNALHVSHTSSIEIEFDAEMDALSINDNTIIVSGSTSGLHQGNITYNPQTQTAEFSPLLPFHPGETVQVIVKRDIKSQSGGTLLNSYIFTFTVMVQNGSAMFEVDSLYPTGDSPFYVSLADFDNDGDLDISSSNPGTDNISIILNQGNGYFSPPSFFATPTNPYGIVSHDLDRDGDIDIAGGSSTAGLFILKNNGNATFFLDTVITVGNNSSMITAGDYNGDTYIDLAVGYNAGISGIVIFYNDGDGRFREDSTYSLTDLTSFCTTDFDGDGDLDIAVSMGYLSNPHNILILFNTGWGNFIPGTLFGTVNYAQSLTNADVDDDGDQDIAFVNRFPGGIILHINDGNGNFSPPNSYYTNSQSSQTFSCDLDGDGDIDFPVTNNMLHGNVFILKNDGHGLLNMTGVISTDTSWTSGINAGDLDNDGDMDIVASSWAGNAISILINKNTPHLVSLSPNKNQLNVALSSDIAITFDEEMDHATLNDSTILIQGNYCGLYQGTISYNPAISQVIIDPVVDFMPGEVITVELTPGIKSVQGAPLSRSTTWSFTCRVPQAMDRMILDSTYIVMTSPWGVTSADMDEDGDLDLLVTNRSDNTVSVLLNIGNGKFFHLSSFPAISSPHQIVAVDFDQDGDIDIATANANSSDIGILLNDGTGVLGAMLAYPSGGNFTFNLTTADFNGDGDEDIAAGNFNSDNISVLLNLGDGTFGPFTNYPCGQEPSSIYTADLDGDFDMDLVTANGLSNDISVLINNGQGSFSLDSSFTTNGLAPTSVMAKDLDGDGDLDLVAVNSASDNISVMLGFGNGTFAPPTLFDVGGDSPRDLKIADMNADGLQDILVVNYNSYSLSILLNDGNWGFYPPVTIPTELTPNALIIGNFDIDGDMDLAVLNLHGNSVSVFLNKYVPLISGISPTQYQNNVADTASVYLSFNVEMDSASIHDSSLFVSGRISGPLEGSISYDNQLHRVKFDPDSAFIHGDKISVTVSNEVRSFDNTSMETGFNWNFTVASLPTPATFFPDSSYITPGFPESVCAADLDRDGDPDLASANYSVDSVYILYNNMNAGFSQPAGYSVGNQPSSVLAFDLTGDDYLDMASVNRASNDISILINNGNGGFLPVSPYSISGQEPRSICSGDFDGDGDNDLITSNIFTDDFSVLLNDGEGNLLEDSVYTVPGHPYSICAADIELDGDYDVICANANMDNLSIILNNGNSIFTADSSYATGSYPVSVCSEDLNADGYPDLVAVCAISGNISIRPNNGDGTFGTHISYYYNAQNPVSLFIADFNGDGYPDLVTANSVSNDVSILLNDGSGHFYTFGDYSVGNHPSSVFASDLDRDGDVDLVVANKNSQSISILINGTSTGVDPLSLKIPTTFMLHQNYPNPFNPVTTIRYDLPQPAFVSLTIYDILGRVVDCPVNEIQQPGFKSVQFKADYLASGIYFYSIKMRNSSNSYEIFYSETKRLILLK